MAKPARSSPILGAVSSMIGEASGTLVTRDGKFRHSFEIPVDAVAPDPTQARKIFEEAEIAGLAATMAEQGQLQPILVRRDMASRNHWIIIAGERRWRAAQLNGWKAILAIEHVGDPEVVSLIENLQRVDLSPIEEARGLQRLIEDKAWSQDHAASVIGKTKSEVSATLRILDLPEKLLDAVLTSELHIPKNLLVELARVDNGTVRDRLVRQAMDGKLTIRAIRQTRAEALEAPSSPEVEAPAGSLPNIRRLIRILRAARTKAVVLSEAERLDLHTLRGEISALLQE